MITRSLWLLVCFVSAAFMCGLNLYAQSPAPLIQNVAGRKAISLNGEWHYLVDQDDDGISRRYYLNGKPYGNRDFVEYGFNAAPTLHVPGDWNFQRPELQFYEGTVWYQKTFDYHARPGTRVFLYFGAANYRTRVWLNEKPLCEHEGGFTPFNCDATSALNDGANVVIVSVNDTRRPGDIPAMTPDWFNYGGLTRDVMLLEMPANFIQQYSVQLDRANPRRIVGWIRPAAGAQAASIRIPELKLSANATADRKVCFAFP